MFEITSGKGLKIAVSIDPQNNTKIVEAIFYGVLHKISNFLVDYIQRAALRFNKNSADIFPDNSDDE